MTDKLAAEWFPTGKLRAWEKNPRRNAQAITPVAESIKRFGFASPIVARREDCRIIAGHTRWQAAKQLGLTEVPVRFVDLSEDEASALAIADNKLGEIAEWDEALLKELEGVDIEFPEVSLPIDEPAPDTMPEAKEGCALCGK